MLSEKYYTSFVLESKSSTNITQAQHDKIRNKLIFKNTLAKYSNHSPPRKFQVLMLPENLLYWCLTFTALLEHFATNTQCNTLIFFIQPIQFKNIAHKSKNS